MRFLLLLYRPVRRPPPPLPGTVELERLQERWRGALGAMAAAGVLVDHADLEPASAASTVRVRQGLALLTDGPAAQAGDTFEGYIVLDCADLDEALRWAATIPTAAGGAVEIRPAAREPPAI